MNWNVNWMSLLAAAIANMVIGFIWYSPALFGNQWMKLMGLTNKSMEKMKKNMGSTYGVMFLGALVMAFVFYQLVWMLNITTVDAAVKVGFWIWLGFVATVQLSQVLFGKKSVNLYVIDTGYYLVSLVVMGAVLVLLR